MTRYTLRGAVSVALAWMLCVDSAVARPAGAASSPAQAPRVQKATVQEQVLEIPAGSLIEVRLKNKEKFRGRLGDISNDGFVVKQARKDKVEDRQITFGEVKSIKMVNKGSNAGRAILYALAGLGVLFLVIGVVAATHTD